MDTYTTFIQLQAYATNDLLKHLGTNWSKYNNVDTYTCKYMQSMAYINNLVQAGATTIMWIPTHAFRYKYMQLMACRNNKVQSGASRIMWIPIHASICNQWHIETIRLKLV